MKKTNFEYIKGKARTNTPWFRPNPELLNAWKKDFYKIPGIEKYQFWVCAGALEDWETWDTDIVVTGKIDSYQEIEDILVAVTQLGFGHRQLIDINWNDSYEKFLSKGPCLRRSICCENYYKHNTCELEHCIVQKSSESIVMATKTIKNGKIMSKGILDPVQIGESLWKRKIKMPSKKQIERIKKGISYKSAPVLITEELDFKNIII